MSTIINITIFFFSILALLLLIGLLRKVYKIWVHYKVGIREIDRMSGHDFERFLERLFGDLGYKSKKTKGSGDYGVDLLLERDGRLIAVQAKRYKSKVNLKAVQEVVSGKAHYNADEAWVVTNSYFAPSAYKLAKSNKVVLINRNDLISLIKKRGNK